MANRGPTTVDAYVGERIRRRRIVVGMSQEQLSSALGVSFQQVQKYEKGQNRIGAGRLFQIAQLLSAPIGFFFDGAPAADDAIHAADRLDALPQPISSESLRLGADFDRIKDPSTRRELSALVRSLAAGRVSPD